MSGMNFCDCQIMDVYLGLYLKFNAIMFTEEEPEGEQAGEEADAEEEGVLHYRAQFICTHSTFNPTHVIPQSAHNSLSFISRP